MVKYEIINIYCAPNVHSADITLFLLILYQTLVLVKGSCEASRLLGETQKAGLTSAVAQAILPLFPMPSFFSPILFSFY